MALDLPTLINLTFKGLGKLCPTVANKIPRWVWFYSPKLISDLPNWNHRPSLQWGKKNPMEVLLAEEEKREYFISRSKRPKITLRLGDLKAKCKKNMIE